jgi:hypothetical protein
MIAPPSLGGSMESTIFVRVVAKPIVYPGDIEIQYECLDDCDIFTGKSYRGLHLSWAEVQHHFCVDQERAKVCEWHFRKGETAFLGNREVTVEGSGKRKAN